MKPTMKSTMHLGDLETPIVDAREAVEALEAVAGAALAAERRGQPRATVDASAVALLCGAALTAFKEFTSAYDLAWEAALKLPPVVDTSGGSSDD